MIPFTSVADDVAADRVTAALSAWAATNVPALWASQLDTTEPLGQFQVVAVTVGDDFDSHVYVDITIERDGTARTLVGFAPVGEVLLELAAHLPDPDRDAAEGPARLSVRPPSEQDLTPSAKPAGPGADAVVRSDMIDHDTATARLRDSALGFFTRYGTTGQPLRDLLT